MFWRVNNIRNNLGLVYFINLCKKKLPIEGFANHSFSKDYLDNFLH